ncbi:MAG TPA: hydantoinase B/oxoprolinase family protein [Candidatus Acidoferrales bacterium]|nr:hydantoinase B/oxoprolinase family protein [Candidatus Acidoferrales bacterium]
MVDPITLQVIQARLAGIVQEMQNSLFRTGYSTIIRESQDASCAILNCQGEVIAQHVVLPLHMGAFPACAAAILKHFPRDEICDGDAFITNHPYLGGSPHAPDMGVLTPIFYKGDWVGFAADMAHKSDIGGTVPGSGSGSAREIFQEGLHLPPVKFVSRRSPVKEIEAMITANSRTPALVIGDLRGQVGAARLGERRIAELMERYGKETIVESTELLSSHTEGRIRQAIALWPDGESEGESFVDHDGIDLARPIRLHVKIKKSGDQIHFDFRDCSDQTQGPANIRPPLVKAAVAYCLVALVDPFLPINQGLARTVDATFREGSVVDPRFPAAVNTYMPTALALTEAVLKALAPFVPKKSIAGGSGSAALVLGGRDAASQRPFVHYEIFSGGTGARSGKDGVSATAFHLSNCKTAPVEIIESEFPARVERFEMISDSGGAGEWRGGLGFARDYRILIDDVRFSMRTDKHSVEPWGMNHGSPGGKGACVIGPETPQEKRLPSRFGDHRLNRGELLRIERPGGGGLGSPLRRPVEKVVEDVRQGYVSIDKARSDYGVVVEAIDGEWQADFSRTQILRGEMQKTTGIS